MPDIIKLKRSGVTGAAPTSLELGEIALNYSDGKIHYKNAAGSIVEFGGSDPRWQYLLPAAPTGVTATGGDAQAVVSWTAPSSLVAITDYVVQFSTNSGSTWTTFSDGTSTSTSATVTGLTNGTSYTFRVAAVSGIGQGAWSAASAAVTPNASDALFSSVSLLLHMDGTGSTFVDSSGTPKAITAYGNATQSTAQSKWGGKSAYFDGSGDYLAVSDAGGGFAFGTADFVYEWWFRSVSTTPYCAMLTRVYDGPGGILMSLNGATGNGRPEIYWREFANALFIRSDTGGFNDGQWHHYAFVRSGTTCCMYIDGAMRGSRTDVSTSVGSSSIHVGDDQQFSGRTYEGYIDDLRITKGSARGYTGSTIAVPTAAFLDLGPSSTAAGAPTSVTGTAGNGQVTLSWTAPASNGGAAITDYVEQYSSNGGATWTTFSAAASTATSATITGLTNGTAYVFRVAAVNAVGTGAYSTASASVTPSNFSPSAVVLTSGTSYTVPSGATTMKAWAIGAGGGLSEAPDGGSYEPGGFAAVGVKTFSVSGGSSVSFAIGATGTVTRGCNTTGNGGNTSVTYAGSTIVGGGGRTFYCYNGSNSGCTNADICGTAGSDVSGLTAAATLAGTSVSTRGTPSVAGAVVLYFT